MVRDRVNSALGALNGPNTYGNSRAFWVAFAVGVAAVFVYPMTMGAYGAGEASLYLLYGFLALSLCFMWGYCGVLSFGQVAFFGIAGYAFGVITLNTSAAMTVPALLASIALATLASAIVGYFMFYGGVRDVYVAIITLVLTLVLHTFMAQTAGSEWKVGSARLGGFNGMPGIPNITAGGFSLSGYSMYYTVAVLLLLTYLCLRVLVNSRYGRVMVAIREVENRARMLGYNTKLVKLAVFTLGGALAGFGGVLFASWGNYVDPSVFSLSFAAIPIVWVSVGGRDSLVGAILATYAIESFSQSLAATGSQWALVVIGGLLLLVIVYMPQGFVPQADEYIRVLRRHARENGYVAPVRRRVNDALPTRDKEVATRDED
jgi:urea transport system permease protein